MTTCTVTNGKAVTKEYRRAEKWLFRDRNHNNLTQPQNLKTYMEIAAPSPAANGSQ
jgi:hypothetical protein